MNFTDKHIVEVYSEMLEGLSTEGKTELIENLSRSLQNSDTENNDAFYKSFGSFASTKSAEDIVAEIKESRRFSSKQIRL